MSKYNRRGGAIVTMGYVEGIKENYPKQYSIPKYIQFIERALTCGFKVILYMPKTTRSKYVTVQYKHKKYKIRWSNHKPIKDLEEQGSCDFFVGVTNLHITTTEQAWEAMLNHFGIQ